MPFAEDIVANAGGRTTALKYGTTDTIRQKFTGYQKDEETSLDFAEARMYSNGLGRFTAVDPLKESATANNPQSWNRYVYVVNNPGRLTDKTGKIVDWVLKDGEMFYDSRVTDQASAKEIYGDKAIYKPNGFKYTASNGHNIQLQDKGNFLDNGRLQVSPDRAEGPIETPNTGHYVVGSTQPLTESDQVAIKRNPWAFTRLGYIAPQNRERAPDFVQGEADVGTVAGQFTCTRYGHAFLEAGAASGVGLNISAGWLSGGRRPGADRLNSFLSGESIGGFATTRFFVGVGATTNSSGTASQVGLGTPGPSASVTYGFRARSYDRYCPRW